MSQLTMRAAEAAKVLTAYQEIQENPERCTHSTVLLHAALRVEVDGDTVTWVCPDCLWNAPATGNDVSAAYDWLIRRVGRDGLDAFL